MYIIASWNINSVRIRINLLKKLIKKIEPDLLLLQEIKCSNEEFPDIFSGLDYNVVTNGQKGKYGVAILIKKKLDFKEIDIESEILNIESRTNFIFVEKLNLKVLNVYTPNGNPTENKEKFKFKLDWMNEIAKLSIVGVGMRSHAGVAAKMFETLSNEGINIQMITTSEIKITVVIDKRYIELAVRALHSAFELAKDDKKA